MGRAYTNPTSFATSTITNIFYLAEPGPVPKSDEPAETEKPKATKPEAKTTSASTKPAKNKPANTDKKMVNNRLPSQHPWTRKFRDSLNAGNPNWLYYLEAVKVFGSEQNMPKRLLDQIEQWRTLGTKAKKRPAAEQQEYEKREAGLESTRMMAAELGSGHANHEALSEAKVVMQLKFIEPSTSKLIVGQKRSRAAGKKQAVNKRARKMAPSRGKSQDSENEEEEEDERNSDSEDNE
ncbi:hypothetical protein FIE12Z_7952 [Fusarium flagelliforme]|uniref:Uncharacterized protein n=1 Tax=Fusarium flagelliforme TaxID=2675880 RepID=A0A395MIQ1_9HYPO|nr:hypothetical protein FIE12Z_7952 [Fusarium flagelliforme]